MKKFECNACGIRICTAEYQIGSGIPFKCTGESGGKAVWREIKELPKLTAEVFDRKDCPEWARYAFVNGWGNCVLLKDKPNLTEYGCDSIGIENTKIIASFNLFYFHDFWKKRKKEIFLPFLKNKK